MNVAFYQGKTISLSTYERELWQALYLASLNNKVTCIHCHMPVQLQLSILEPPTFKHSQLTDQCLEAANEMEKRLQQPEHDTTQVANGFQLPKSRTISHQHKNRPSHVWKKPEYVEAIPPFQAIQHTTNGNLSGYRKELYQRGIHFDESQWEAVTTTEGPVMILAGAGSGKTRVLTARAAYMLTELHYSPKKLIMVTFTAKAAKEMKERMATYPKMNQSLLNQLMIGTFHRIFYKILLHHEPKRWASSLLLNMDWQRQAILKSAGREIDIDEKDFAYDQALTQISLWKNHMLTPELVKTTNSWEEKILYLYKRYEAIKKENQSFDFDDMLLGAYDLFKKHPDILSRYQRRFTYVSVDEFQDTNKIQYELITMLTKSNNLCIVGDDDQSIYAFRGSDPSFMLHFDQAYPHLKKVLLNQNYRSSHEIVSTAHNIITSNRTRFQKQLIAQQHSEQLPLMFYPFNQEEEATMIVQDIKQKVQKGHQPNDFAILFRTNTAARALIERFIQSSIPFQLEMDGESFYKRRTVRKVLAYLRLAFDENDTKALTDLVGALFLKQEVTQEVKSLSITEDCSFIDALAKVNGIQPFQQRKLRALPAKFDELRRLQPYEAIVFIEREMGLADYVKKQGNEGNKMDRGSDDIKDLKEVAKLHESIEGFLQYIDHMTAKFEEFRLQRSATNAVQLLTIHRSKGLEFKHVYLIEAVEGGIPHDYALEALRDGDKQPLEEERRLMYVAITRAIDTLSISIPSKRRGKQVQRSRFVREMNQLSTRKLTHRGGTST
ncbi:ATP-dependent helicase [Halalkalibacter sp. AB-rgal2]|uniref:ATP-dependent helicase n=1 Tax=Halalkalibacter sp. AB-rgal2 TaxID=3242695 RepID=UPI00359D5BAA